ncbi:transcriptional repressor [bacterium]|nr:transcriptional repressor [bacterium]
MLFPDLTTPFFEKCRFYRQIFTFSKAWIAAEYHKPHSRIDLSAKSAESGGMPKTLPCGRKQAPHAHSGAHTNEWKGLLDRYLKEKSLRATRPREQVAEVAMSRETHFDIQTLIKEVRLIHPEISPATVYRSVNTLCEAGILTETLRSQGGVTLYESALEEHHDHVVCMDCGEIFEFHDASVEKAQHKAIESMGFEEVRHRHVVYARCTRLKKA